MDNKAQWSLVTAAWVLAIGVIGLGIFAIRHFSVARIHTAPGQIQSFGTATKPLCPVDRDEVSSDPATPHVNFNGTIYFFCDHKDLMGRSHKMLFLMDPLLYLTGVSGQATPQPTQAPPAAAAVQPTATATISVTTTATSAPSPAGARAGLRPGPLRESKP